MSLGEVQRQWVEYDSHDINTTDNKGETEKVPPKTSVCDNWSNVILNVLINCHTWTMQSITVWLLVSIFTAGLYLSKLLYCNPMLLGALLKCYYIVIRDTSYTVGPSMPVIMTVMWFVRWEQCIDYLCQTVNSCRKLIDRAQGKKNFFYLVKCLTH